MTRMTTSEAVVETLRAESITEIFGIVGSAYMDLLDLLPAAGIRFVAVRHEQSAAHMADGYSRVTGKPSLCIGQNGPGITNMVTSIAAAYHAHSPVVIVTPSAMSALASLTMSACVRLRCEPRIRGMMQKLHGWLQPSAIFT